MSDELMLPSFQRILLITDFSACSEAAVPFARIMAERYDASVVVAHVVPGAGAATEETTRNKADAAQEAEAEMREFIARNPLGEVPVETVIERGPVAEALAALIKKQGIDLIAVGTHGRSGVGKLLLGSIAQRIFNVASCPVLSVSPRAGKPFGAAARFPRILYPTDFSEESLVALPYALSLARTDDSALVLLHAASEPPRQEVMQEYYRRLNALVPSHARKWCKSDALVTVGEPAEAILKSALEQNADLVVISAHRAEGAFHVPLTTAYQVVARVHCPVLRVVRS